MLQYWLITAVEICLQTAPRYQMWKSILQIGMLMGPQLQTGLVAIQKKVHSSNLLPCLNSGAVLEFLQDGLLLTNEVNENGKSNTEDNFNNAERRWN